MVGCVERNFFRVKDHDRRACVVVVAAAATTIVLMLAVLLVAVVVEGGVMFNLLRVEGDERGADIEGVFKLVVVVLVAL